MSRTVFITARKRSLGQGNIFTPVCHSVHRGGMCGCGGEAGGGRAWLLGGAMCGCSGGMRGCLGGHAWLLLGGVHGCSRGACMVARGVCMVASGGRAWLLQGGMGGCSGGHAWLLWVGGIVCGIRRDTEIRSMSGRYASYWNAFLLLFKISPPSVFLRGIGGARIAGFVLRVQRVTGNTEQLVGSFLEYSLPPLARGLRYYSQRPGRIVSNYYYSFTFFGTGS